MKDLDCLQDKFSGGRALPLSGDLVRRELAHAVVVDRKNPTDFTWEYVNKIIANGKKAYHSIVNIQQSLPPIEIFLAVSTSRAYPMAFEKKLSLWRELLT
jgi:hypothetical protein